MRLQLKTIRRQLFGKRNQLCSPTFTPFGRIDEQTVDRRILHGEVSDDALIERANPDRTTGPDDILKDPTCLLKRERLPRREIGICGKS